MRKIIQLTHPGTQLNLSKRSTKNGQAYFFKDPSSGIRYWNCENSHHRKFLKANGKVYSNSEPMELLFWGEWEAQAEFSLLNGGRLMPNAVYKPFYQETDCKKHTTDPFVFGKNFYYSNCKQLRFKKLLGSLESGDIILFGSCFTEGFLLDTFFVVDKSFTSKEYLSQSDTFPKILQETGPSLNDLYKKNRSLKLYRSLNENQDSKLFSFVPAKPFQGNSSGFTPLKLDYEKYNLSSFPTVCSNLNKNGEVNLSAFLKNLDKDMKVQNFLKCTEFEEPKILKGKDNCTYNSTISGCGVQVRCGEKKC